VTDEVRVILGLSCRAWWFGRCLERIHAGSKRSIYAVPVHKHRRSAPVTTSVNRLSLDTANRRFSVAYLSDRDTTHEVAGRKHARDRQNAIMNYCHYSWSRCEWV